MDDPACAGLVRAAASGISLFAAHTNLDAAPGGVNDALAGRLGLENLRPLAPLNRGLAKLVFFAPPEQAQAVLDALFAAGAGRIGDYRECCFSHPGTGAFKAPMEGNPFLGEPGSHEEVDESRVETVVPLAGSGRVIKALYEAHPYEEPAFDLYPLEQGPAGVGVGRVGELPRAMAGDEFVSFAVRELGAVAPQLAGELPAEVKRVALVGGSGGDLVELAAASGAQVFITGEAKHNQAYDARNAGICLLCLGHYETEEVVVKPWAGRLARMAGEAGLDVEILPFLGGDNPWRTPPVS
jgi:dinuclear metal center YbgI/SA1388 family protein